MRTNKYTQREKSLRPPTKPPTHLNTLQVKDALERVAVQVPGSGAQVVERRRTSVAEDVWVVLEKEVLVCGSVVECVVVVLERERERV